MAAGRVEVFWQSFDVDRQWAHRLVRVEVDLKGGWLLAYRLRWREPGDQPLLMKIRHQIKNKGFKEYCSVLLTKRGRSRSSARCFACTGTCHVVPVHLFRMLWHIPIHQKTGKR